MDERSVGRFKWCERLVRQRTDSPRRTLLRSEFYHKPLMMHEWRGSGLKAWERRELRVAKPVRSGVEGVSPGSPIACHAEAVCEGRSILPCSLRFRRGSLSFARPFPSFWSSSVTNSTGFLLLFGSGPIALAPFLAFLTQLLLVQIRLELFIGKTTAETSGGNCQCRCNFYWPATRYHMPWAFRQRIAIRKRKLTTTRSTLMCHSLSYRGRLSSSNAEVAMRATSLSTRSSYSIRTVESFCSILNVNDNVRIARYIAVCLRLSIA